VVILVFGFALVAAQWHTSPESESFVAIRKDVQLAGIRRADLRGGHAVPP